MKTEQILAFRYKGLFQLLEIRFFKTTSENTQKIHCDANIQLPLLKKQYQVSTVFLQTYKEWKTHSPVCEKGASANEILRQAMHGESLDPIGFFMTLHREEWLSDSVDLLIGQKIVRLDVKKTSAGYEISRKDKNQKLIVVKGNDGIKKIEIPLPVIGTVTVDRWG